MARYSPERDNALQNRDDARRLLASLTTPLLDCFSAGRAQARVGVEAAHFDRKAEWFEGFARPLWGLAPLHAGGGAFAHWDLFRAGIASGTDPAHPEYWEAVGDQDQRAVEMAALGFALALAPQELWDGLDARAQGNLARWLGDVQSVEMADNNWHFFPVLAGLGLERVGLSIDRASRERHLARIEEFHVAEGWYGDGPQGFVDHYNGFALQFYGLIYAALAGERDPVRAARYRERAAGFARGFQHWFGADGGGLAIGRSLTYRFAMAAFWGALAYAGVEALPWGAIRGLWARHMRWWLQQPMLDDSGRLAIGYRWPNLLMSEEYNSQGSPYWAFKAFLPLALGDEHPFWTAPEQPHPAPEGVTMLRGAKMLVQRSAGDVVALPAAPVRTDMRNSTDKYAKFAYSTRFGLTVEADRWLRMGLCGDNILAFSADRLEWRSRTSIAERRIGEDWIETGWQPRDGLDLRTLQFFVDGWEIRAHRVTASGRFWAVESGHALPSHTSSRRHFARMLTEDVAGEPGLALVLPDGSASAAVDLGDGRRAAALACAPNTSLMFPMASVPALLGRIEPGTTLLLGGFRGGCAHAPPRRERVAAMLRAAEWEDMPALSFPDAIRMEQRASADFPEPPPGA